MSQAKVEEVKDKSKTLKVSKDPNKKFCKTCEKELDKSKFGKGRGSCKECEKGKREISLKNSGPITCNQCGETKDPSQYYISNRSRCIECVSGNYIQWGEDNPEQKKATYQAYISIEENHQRKLETDRIYRETYPEEKKARDTAYREAVKDNPEYKQKKLESNNNYRNNSRENNPSFVINEKICRKINDLVHDKRVVKNSTINYFGCDKEHFRKWIEYQFNENMSWDNYGIYWNIDHVLCMKCFEFETEEEPECKECHFWMNLRPIEKIKNCQKKSSVVDFDINYHNHVVNTFVDKHKINKEFLSISFEEVSKRILKEKK